MKISGCDSWIKLIRIKHMLGYITYYYFILKELYIFCCAIEKNLEPDRLVLSQIVELNIT